MGIVERKMLFQPFRSVCLVISCIRAQAIWNVDYSRVTADIKIGFLF